MSLRVRQAIGSLGIAALCAFATLAAPPHAAAERLYYQAARGNADVDAAPTREPSPNEVSLARSLFSQGLEAARAKDWPKARDKFERSYRLVPAAASLLNLAGAYTQTGELVAALEAYRLFLRVSEQDGRYAKLRPAAEKQLGELEPRIPRVKLAITGLSMRDRVELDDQPLSTAALGGSLPVDPGSHTLRVKRGKTTIVEHGFALTEGRHEDLAFELEPDTFDPNAVAENSNGSVQSAPFGTGAAHDDDRNIFSSPWFWGGVGAVAVAGAVVAVVLLSSSGGDGGSTPTGSLGVINVP